MRIVHLRSNQVPLTFINIITINLSLVSQPSPSSTKLAQHTISPRLLSSTSHMNLGVGSSKNIPTMMEWIDSLVVTLEI